MTDLDAEELFHLALKASESGDRDKTISYLKRSIALEPKAASLYILAAEYAEIGMYERATAGMHEAIELDPNLWTAYFQLGLLYLTQNLIQEARNTWATLLELGPDEYLYHFAKGLTELVDEQADAALESLRTGIALNQDNPALNRDVGSIIKNIVSARDSEADLHAAEAAEPAPAAAVEATAAPAEARARQHLFLSNYDENADGQAVRRQVPGEDKKV